MCSDGCREFCQDTGFQVSGQADNWPLGTGALINQQTTHRGEAHLDPSAPDRVLFILTFAPRPQTKPATIETRLIGVSGSYSLHWSQWGHTLADFQRPLAKMQQPWRTLRSLGLYKPRKSQWGWDYITVSSGRIANEDTGFTSGDLYGFVEVGGFPWLPRRLQGNTTDEAGFVWVSTLVDTVRKCRHESGIVHRGLLGVYVICSILFTLSSRRQRVKWRSSTALWISRLVVYHGSLLLVALLIFHRAINSSWGRNIHSKRSFSLAETLTLHSDLPATLPTEHDILVFEGLKSSYLDSYTGVLEIFHPGNKAWNGLIAAFSSGYEDLSPSLQDHVQRSLLNVTREEGRRVLVQSTYANWAVAPPRAAARFCHKSLWQQSNLHVNAAVESLDYLLSETRYGYWRASAMHRHFVSKLIAGLRDKILGEEPRERLSASNIRFNNANAKASFNVASSILDTLPERRRSGLIVHARRGIPPRVESEPLLSQLWMQEGDMVEANVHGTDDGKFRIVARSTL
jgi:hypothetical protein